MKIARRYYFSFLLSLFALTNANAQYKARAKGNLFVFGGDIGNSTTLSKLITTADLRYRDDIVVLPMAASQPDTAFKQLKTQLANLCNNKVTMLNFDDYYVTDPDWLDQLGTAKLIIILDGDKQKFMQTVLNTPVYKSIHRAYKYGSTIAGPSVLGRYYIADSAKSVALLGDTIALHQPNFKVLKENNITLKNGLGLLDSVILEQHTIQKSRYNRLISALYMHPHFNCIGVDDHAALVVQQNTAKILGESQVIKISSPQNISVNQNGLIKFQDLRMSLFTDGDSFYIE